MNKKRISGFLVFLFGASLLWFVSKYKDVYTDSIKLEVSWIQVPKDLKLKNEDYSIEVNAVVKQRGFSLLWNKLNTYPIELDFKKFTTLRNDSIFYQPMTNLESFQEEFPDLRIVKIQNKEFHIPVIKYASKKVALKRNFDIEFKENFQEIEDVGFSTDSIVLYGDADRLKKIDIIEIDGDKLVVNDTLTTVSYAIPDLGETVDSNFKTVSYAVRAAEMTEGRITLPVSLTDKPDGVYIKLIPTEVTVIYQSTLQDFDRITAENFNVIIPFKSIESTNSTVIPELKIMGEGIHQARIKEESVQILVVE